MVKNYSITKRLPSVYDLNVSQNGKAPTTLGTFYRWSLQTTPGLIAVVDVLIQKGIYVEPCESIGINTLRSEMRK